ncbi:unnamed protein product [Moneuplotes crassus]|uniref:Uncharacterized protein n=1 Tax=Euplotes crassus TaxID=5936 RepID=A0AAD1Y9R5_EUPCR|nr:unnamed protein product [Moneuplotes crassus]
MKVGLKQICIKEYVCIEQRTKPSGIREEQKNRTRRERIKTINILKLKSSKPNLLKNINKNKFTSGLLSTPKLAQKPSKLRVLNNSSSKRNYRSNDNHSARSFHKFNPNNFPPNTRAGSVQLINTTRVSIAEQILDYELVPNDLIQSKIDYFITPYNKQITCHKHMDFGKSILTSEEFLRVMNGEDIIQDSKRWKTITDIILKVSDKSFEASINTVNKDARPKLKALLGRLIRLQRKNPRISLYDLCSNGGFTKSEIVILSNCLHNIRKICERFKDDNPEEPSSGLPNIVERSRSEYRIGSSDVDPSMHSPKRNNKMKNFPIKFGRLNLNQHDRKRYTVELRNSLKTKEPSLRNSPKKNSEYFHTDNQEMDNAVRSNSFQKRLTRKELGMKSKLFSQCIVESVDKSKSKGKFSVIYGAKKSRNNMWYSKKAKTIKEFATAFTHRRSIAVPSKYEKNIKMTKWQDINKVLSNLEKEEFPMLRSFNYARDDSLPHKASGSNLQKQNTLINLIEPLKEETMSYKSKKSTEDSKDYDFTKSISKLGQ